MAFQDTSPKRADTNNNLLFKIAQALNSGGGGGGGDSLWQFSGGSIHPITANRSITSYSGNFIANPGAADGSPVLAVNSTATHSSGNLFIVANNGSPKLSINIDGGIVGEGGITLNGGASFSSNTALLNGEVADGSTPYTFDTSLEHTSGSLLQVKNAGINNFEVAFDGTVYGNASVSQPWWGANSSAFVHFRDVSDTNTNNSGFGLLDGNDDESSFYFICKDDTCEIQAYYKGDKLMVLRPSANSGLSAYTFDTSTELNSGFLMEVKNDGVIKVSIAPDGVLDAVAFAVGGAAGVSGTITGASTVTVVNGIITAIA